MTIELNTMTVDGKPYTSMADIRKKITKKYKMPKPYAIAIAKTAHESGTHTYTIELVGCKNNQCKQYIYNVTLTPNSKPKVTTGATMAPTTPKLLPYVRFLSISIPGGPPLKVSHTVKKKYKIAKPYAIAIAKSIAGKFTDRVTYSIELQGPNDGNHYKYTVILSNNGNPLVSGGVTKKSKKKPRKKTENFWLTGLYTNDKYRTKLTTKISLKLRVDEKTTYPQVAAQFFKKLCRDNDKCERILEINAKRQFLAKRKPNGKDIIIQLHYLP